jgi:putative oxidoreductase
MRRAVVMKKVWRIVSFWVLPTLMGLLFVLIGLGKFGAPGWQRNFERWGYPDGAYAVVGVAEMLGGVLLLVPRFTTWSVAGLYVILVGAIGTHLAYGETNRLVSPVLYVLLLGLAGYARRESRLGARAAVVKPGT